MSKEIKKKISNIHYSSTIIIPILWNGNKNESLEQKQSAHVHTARN